jgi:hypothetical protein
MSFSKATVSCRGLFYVGSQLYGLFAQLDPGVDASARLVLRLTDPDAHASLACPFYAHIIEHSDGDLHEWKSVCAAEFLPPDIERARMFISKHTMWPRLLTTRDQNVSWRELAPSEAYERLPVFPVLPAFVWNWQHDPRGMHGLGPPANDHSKGRLIDAIIPGDWHWPYFRLLTVRSLHTLLTRDLPPGSTGGCNLVSDSILLALDKGRDPAWIARLLPGEAVEKLLSHSFVLALMRRHPNAAARLMGERLRVKLKEETRFQRGDKRYVPHFMLGAPTLVSSRELATNAEVRRHYLEGAGYQGACVVPGGAATIVRLVGSPVSAKELHTLYGDLVRFVPVSFVDYMRGAPDVMTLPDLVGQNDGLKKHITPYTLDMALMHGASNVGFTNVGVQDAHLLSLTDLLRLLRLLKEGRAVQRVIITGCTALAPLVDAHKDGTEHAGATSAVRELMRLPLAMQGPEFERPIPPQYMQAVRELVTNTYSTRFRDDPVGTRVRASSPAALMIDLRKQREVTRPVVAVFPKGIKMVALDELFCYLYLLKKHPSLRYDGVSAQAFAQAFEEPAWRPASWGFYSEADLLAGLTLPPPS